MIAATPGGLIMDATALLKEFCSAVERRDGKAFASLFTEDGVYNDVFYGAFKGHEKIAEMVDDWFHRTARDFRWDMHRPVSNGEMLYAYYTFSYVSKLAEADGKRVGFEGVSMMKLRDGKIAEYREVANVGPAFVELGFAPERTAKILAKEGTHLKKQPEFQRHLA
jgi:ketosteroid isomerase-like protein